LQSMDNDLLAAGAPATGLAGPVKSQLLIWSTVTSCLLSFENCLAVLDFSSWQYTRRPVCMVDHPIWYAVEELHVDILYVRLAVEGHNGT